ncbi:MAG: ribosome silencing factor [Lachnospiraceae bacterium]|nr:ribosome silencing factor [Lachnospiraceae bacterium]
MNPKEIAKNAFLYLDEKKAIDIKIIDISKISVIADYFIICGGSNSRQVKAIAENVEEKLGKAGVIPKSTEGYQNANWILLDYQDVIIHIFNQEQRLFYDLERIWSDGNFVEVSDL